MSEKALAGQTIEHLTQAGFDKAASKVSYDELHELSAENGEINLLRTNFETDIHLTGIMDQRRASLAVNKTDEGTLGSAINDMKEMAKGGNPDPAFDIAEYQPPETFQAGPVEPDYDAMYDRVEEIHRYVQDTYPALNLRNVGITFVRRRGCYVNSNGVEFESTRGLYQAGITFSSREGKDTSSMMFTGYTAYNIDTPIHESANVDMLLRQSTEQVRTEHIPEKFMGDLVIAPNCLADFLGFLTMRIGDGPMISGTSVYLDKLGEKVASDRLTLRSKPVSDEITTGYWVTGDGYKASNNTVVEDGVLKSYLLSLYGANRTGRERAPNSGGCYVVEPGDESFDDIVAGVDQGILITRFSGGRPNDRGDFSGVAKNSYYIKDGRIQYPIKETTVSGNMVDLLQSITAVSRERVHFGGSWLPWVRVEGITAS